MESTVRKFVLSFLDFASVRFHLKKHRGGVLAGLAAAWFVIAPDAVSVASKATINLVQTFRKQ
jgi:hypothetical protein